MLTHMLETSGDSAMISDNCRSTPEGGWAVRFINKTGAPSIKGMVVMNVPSTSMGVQHILVDVPAPIGVIYEAGVPDGEYMWVVIAGIAEVLFTNTTTASTGFARGFLTADGGSYVAGKALAEAFPTTPFASDKHFYEIGQVLEAKTAGQLVKCLIHFN